MVATPQEQKCVLRDVIPTLTALKKCLHFSILYPSRVVRAEPLTFSMLV
jgi:hypothetical protein